MPRIAKKAQKKHADIFGNQELDIGKIFLDENHLESGVLKQKIKAELRKSQFLLVICSHNSHRANSSGINWVDREIRIFLDPGYDADDKESPETLTSEEAASIPLEQKEKVIPLHVPPAKWKTALGMAPKGHKNHEPSNIYQLGLCGENITIKDGGKERAFTNLAANILGMEKDDLWNHLEKEIMREKRKNRIIWSLVWSFIISLLLFLVSYFVPFYGYYADYEELYNIPNGIRPLSPEERKQCDRHYKFTWQCYQLQKVECLDAAGNPTAAETPWNPDRPATITFNYDLISRKLTSRTFYNETGQILIRQNTPSDDVIELNKINSNKKSLGSGFISHYVRPMFYTDRNDQAYYPRPDVKRLRIVRNSRGQVVDEFFQNDTRDARVNEGGAYGRRFEYDGHSIKSMRYIDKKGDIMADRNGVAGYNIEYKNGLPISKYYVDAANNKRILYPEGYSGQLYEWTGNRWTKCTHVDPGGVPTINTVRGFSMSVCSINEKNGLCEKDQFYDSRGEPCINSDGCHSYHKEYDDEGKLIRDSFYGVDGAKVNCKFGYHLRTIEHNNDEQLIHRYYNADGEPCVHKDGNYGQHVTTTANGMTWSFIDVNGAPMMHKNGYAMCKKIYRDDTVPARTKYEFYDKKHNLITTKMGYAQVLIEHDAKGNITKEQYLNEKGEAAFTEDGINTMIHEYDEKGYRVSTKFYVCDGETYTLTYNKWGFAQIERELDSLGNCTRVSLYNDKEGNDKKLVCEGNNVAIYEFTPRNQSNTEEERYFGADGEATYNHEHVASTRKVYNDKGFLVKQLYFQLNKIYDNEGRLIKKLHFNGDEDGALCSYEEKASVNMSYDDKGRLSRETYFENRQIEEGSSEEMRCPASSSLGYFGKQYIYDDDARIKETHYLDAGDELYEAEGFRPIEKEEKDAFGNLICHSYHDKEGNLDDNNGTTFASVRYQYDNLHRKTREEYFDKAGQRCNGPENYSIGEYQYDDRGNITRRSYLTADGKPASRIVQRFGVRKNIITPGDYDIITPGDDDRITIITIITTGDYDNPFSLTLQVAAIETKYNELDNAVEEKYFIAHEGKVVPPPQGIMHITRWEYDERGNLTSEKYYDRDNHAVKNALGFAHCTVKRNAAGNMTETAFYDTEGNPCMAEGLGYAFIRYEYSSPALLSSHSYYNEKGEPCEAAYGGGYARLEYNTEGYVVRKIKLNELLHENEQKGK